jgi:paraquat-inducible protein B
VSLTGVTGLSTLVSGDYIGFEGGSGAPKRQFEGLEEGPDVAAEKGGREYVLRSDDLGSVSDGAPLLFHGITVGKVERVELSDKREVLLHVFVDSPHESLVRENSRFWNVSGIEISAGDLLDASVRIASLQSLIAGGIAFDNPAPEGAEAKAGMTFDLYDRAPEDLIPVEEIAGLELRFSLPELHGLSVGSAVMFKGFQVGEVVGADLSEKGGDIEIRAVVEEAYRHLVKTSSVFWLSGGLNLSLTSLFSSKQEATVNGGVKTDHGAA